MDKPIYIEYLDCYIPETKLELAGCTDLEESIAPYFSGRAEFLKYATSVLCLDNIRVGSAAWSGRDGHAVIRSVSESQGAAARTVKYIIVATDQSSDLKDYGHHILRRLAIPRSTVFRVTDNYCVNIDLAIGLAATLLRANQEPSRAIIISGTKNGNGLAKRVVGTYGILGDSAGITVLSNEKGSHYLAEVGGQAVISRGELAEIDLTKDNTLLHLNPIPFV